MYSPVPHKSEDESVQEDYDTLLPASQHSRHARSTRRAYLWLYILLGLMFSASLFVSGLWIGSRTLVDKANICPSYVQHFSPLMKEVDTSYHLVRFNGSFLHENSFRKTAGEEVDAAWASLGVHYRVFALPASEAAASGIKPDQVQINEKYGGGFPANVEGLHHLHCLNLVRQALYYNYDYYHARKEGAFVNEDNIVQYHVSHCLDIIRQQLMCTVDTGALGQVWWDPSAPKPFVDFNTEHKCKNFDAIRQWAEERQLPAQVPSDFLRPPRKSDLVYEEIP